MQMMELHAELDERLGTGGVTVCNTRLEGRDQSQAGVEGSFPRSYALKGLRNLIGAGVATSRARSANSRRRSRNGCVDQRRAARPVDRTTVHFASYILGKAGILFKHVSHAMHFLWRRLKLAAKSELKEERPEFLALTEGVRPTPKSRRGMQKSGTAKLASTAHRGLPSERKIHETVGMAPLDVAS